MGPEIIIRAALMALFCIGLHKAMEEGMILGKLGESLRSYVERGLIPSWIGMPMGACIYCMSTFWGTFVYLVIIILSGVKFADILAWPLAMVVCLGIISSLRPKPSVDSHHGNTGRAEGVDHGAGAGSGTGR